MLDYHLLLITLHRGLQLVLSKTIRTADTKYHISYFMYICYLHRKQDYW